MSDKGPVPQRDYLETAFNVLLSSALADSQKISVQHEDIVPFFRGLLTESDRAIPVLAFGFIESRIASLFSQQLNPAVRGGVQSVIGQQGILEGVGAQIKMLHALHWLRSETARDLYLLARIRNRFAHAHAAIGFDDAGVQGLLSSITVHEAHFASDYPKATLRLRHTYLVRAVMTVGWLHTDMVLMPSSLRSGLGPTGVFRAGFDKYPAGVKQAMTSCVEAVDLVHKSAETE